ncbi:MAG: hypothetical protein WC734_06055 [Patescibacteria group bacterium]|jgi:hypothetical protein
MLKEEYDMLDSDGRVACPVCGTKKTEPCGGCWCPDRIGGYGTRHINKYHHRCPESAFTTITTTAPIKKEPPAKAEQASAPNNTQPVNFVLKFIYWIGAKLRAFFCSLKKLWRVAKVR